jgi:hypothetical protein
MMARSLGEEKQSRQAEYDRWTASVVSARTLRKLSGFE